MINDLIYVYCIKEKTKEHPTFSLKGIDGKGEVFTLTYRELEAIVSKVSLEEFGSGEIQKKSQEDLGWIKEKAVAHEKVIEEAMRNKDNVLSVIPMRFGTIFKEKTSLEEALNKDYAKIKEVFER
ncbi:MAG: GvpL/GvpF family gas vesicle protein, partial [Bacteroidales bacterium]